MGTYFKIIFNSCLKENIPYMANKESEEMYFSLMTTY